MKIIFMGNQTIGYNCLKYLIENKENVQAVFAICDSYWKKFSNKEKSNYNWYPSVGELSTKSNIPTYYPENINSHYYVDLINNLNPDIIFSISWEQMIGVDILKIPNQGAINMHGSLLPKNRGHAPINWAIIRGEKITGFTMHYMSEKADAGDIIAQKECQIYFEDTAITLSERLMEAGLNLFAEQFPLIKQGKSQRFFNKIEQGNYNKRRRPEDGQINWNRSALDIYNWIRALTRPYPGAFTYWNSQKL
ncbi:MAG: methionyl-tRNA formyltransferase, partial [Oligoflexia bacterium]|nr:methionyl-tRNA formyltransferase [Oligoflexia bacterium]